MTSHFFSRGRIVAVATALLFLAGCTTFSNDGGFNTVSTTASGRLGNDAVLGVIVLFVQNLAVCFEIT